MYECVMYSHAMAFFPHFLAMSGERYSERYNRDRRNECWSSEEPSRRVTFAGWDDGQRSRRVTILHEGNRSRSRVASGSVTGRHTRNRRGSKENRSGSQGRRGGDRSRSRSRQGTSQPWSRESGLKALEARPSKNSLLMSSDPADYFPVNELGNRVEVPPLVLPHPLDVESVSHQVVQWRVAHNVLRKASGRVGSLLNPVRYHDAFYLMKDLLVAWRSKFGEMKKHKENMLSLSSFRKCREKQNVREED